MSIAGLINENNMGIGTSGAIQSEPTGLMAVTGNMVNATLKNYNFLSSRNLQNKQIEKQYDSIQNATGQKLEDIIGDDYKSDSRWSATDKYILEQREINPEFSDIPTTAEMREAARQEAIDANVEYQAAASGAGGFNRGAGTVIGGLAGAMTDPLNLGATVATAGLAAGMRLNLLRTVALEAGVNVGIETINQPFIASWQNELGNEYGLGDALANVAFAGVAGAAFTGLPPVIKAGSRQVRAKGAVILDNIATSPKTPEYLKDSAKAMAHRANVIENTPFVKDTPKAMDEHAYNVKQMDEAINNRKTAQDADLKFTEKTIDGISPARQRMTTDPASWVVRNKETGEIVMETFQKSVIDKLNKEKFEAVPIIDYLESLNRKPIKQNAIKYDGKEFDFKGQSKAKTDDVFANKVAQPPQGIREKADDLFDGDKYLSLKETTVPVRDIVPTQRFLGADNLDEVMDVGKSTDAFLVYDNGKYYVLDGHHRIASNIVKGEAEIKARVYNSPFESTKTLSKNESEYLSTDIRKSDSYETLDGADLSRKDNRMMDDLADFADKSGDEVLDFDGRKVTMKELYEEIQAGENLLKAVKVCAL